MLLISTIYLSGYPVPTFNWFLEYQTITSEILTQPSRYKRAESNLQADEKGPQH